MRECGETSIDEFADCDYVRLKHAYHVESKWGTVRGLEVSTYSFLLVPLFFVFLPRCPSFILRFALVMTPSPLNLIRKIECSTE